ncbi:MAG: SpoIIE family protein phosphatase [Terriglobales bacterium]
MAVEPAAPHLADVTSFMLEVSDVVSGTLDLDQVLHRVADLVRRVIHYEVFAILLANEPAQELRVRFSVGHLPEVVETVRVKFGQGITGEAAARRQPLLVNDVSRYPGYIPVLQDIRSELAVPILWNNRCIGVMDIQAPECDAFSEAHQQALVLVASRIANAIENAKLYRNAVQREKTLSLLNDISREMTSILSLDDLLTRTAEMVRRVIEYQLFSVLLINAAGDKLEHRLSVKMGENIQIRKDIPLGKGITGAAMEQRRAVVVKDVREDPRYIQVNPDARSELAVPLVHQDQVLGVLDLEHNRKGYYTERHARTINTLAAQMAIAMANARLYEKVSRAERQMERDLRMAQEIQEHLLPARRPQLEHLQIAARTVSARQLGGDLYDFIPYRGQRTAIAVGDVSGKGTGAALYGAVVSGILRTQALRHPRPAELLGALNQALLERQVESQFMTLIYALWSERSRRLRVANSGLPYPIHAGAQGCSVIPAAGIPLGMLDGSRYEECQLRLPPGEMVVFVSDGITEFMNPKGEEYGRTRLENLLRRHYSATPEAVMAAIFEDSEHFGAGLPAADDRTVVVLKSV